MTNESTNTEQKNESTVALIKSYPWEVFGILVALVHLVGAIYLKVGHENFDMTITGDMYFGLVMVSTLPFLIMAINIILVVVFAIFKNKARAMSIFVTTVIMVVIWATSQVTFPILV